MNASPLMLPFAFSWLFIEIIMIIAMFKSSMIFTVGRNPPGPPGSPASSRSLDHQVSGHLLVKSRFIEQQAGSERPARTGRLFMSLPERLA